MSRIKQLATMAAGIGILCSSALPWLNNSSPSAVGLGSLISNFVQNVSSGNVIINLSVLDAIPIAIILFLLGVAVVASAVLSSRKIAVLSSLAMIAIVVMWLTNSGIDLASIVTNFGALGVGTDIAVAGTITTLVCIILAH